VVDEVTIKRKQLWYLLNKIAGYELGSHDFIPGSREDFSLRDHMLWHPIGFLFNGYWGLFPGCIVEIKNAWSYTSCTRLFALSFCTVVVVVVEVVIVAAVLAVLLLNLNVEKDTSSTGLRSVTGQNDTVYITTM